jgi:hypothetical protein
MSMRWTLLIVVLIALALVMPTPLFGRPKDGGPTPPPGGPVIVIDPGDGDPQPPFKRKERLNANLRFRSTKWLIECDKDHAHGCGGD